MHISTVVSSAACLHCGLPTPEGARFCCPGCHAAYDIVQGMGLGSYYLRRALDASQRPMRPDPEPRADLAEYIVADAQGGHSLSLAVDGVQCGACVWLIEAVLARQPGIETARVNMTTRRLRLQWQGAAEDGARYCGVVESLGYRVAPFHAAQSQRGGADRALIQALAVAGFAAGNVMLLSLGTWFGATQNMGPRTLQLMHWLSALIALPAACYACRPFVRSALGALRHGRTNMDVPVSVGVLLVLGLSLWQTMLGGAHAYFDSACTLLFFLLIGRVLEQRARGQARATAEQLLLLRETDVSRRDADGAVRRVPKARLAAGDIIVTAMGERVGADGVLLSGEAQLDSSIVTGESLPETVREGAKVFAGSVNLGPAIAVRVTATGDATLLAECVRLIEAAEQARGKFVVLADRVARLYTPFVHLAALATLLGWLATGHAFAPSLVAAVAVLIITCPCALALAIPVVQVVATSRLLRAGILLKSPTALERLARVDTVVFDKTGTLTEPLLAPDGAAAADVMALAARLAAHSRHPLCRALLGATEPAAPYPGAVEMPGQGIVAAGPQGEIRMGSRAFCGLPPGASAGPELWLKRPGEPAVVVGFSERLRADAPATLERLRRFGIAARIASGDQAESVARIAAALEVDGFAARQTPPQKAALIAALRGQGRQVMMVGDGLNDSPCLAAALVSAAPATAADISQTVADVVYQGEGLSPVASLIRVARRARWVMRENLAMSLVYNAVMLPLAAAGYVTPWVAALAMSTSSILVITNALRVQGVKL
jgi:Cu2+-exporting ATPase